MTLVEDLQSYQARRRFPGWKPEPATDIIEDTSKPADQVILRALDFLPLELQVAEWDREAVKSVHPWLSAWKNAEDSEILEVQRILERNAADEDKHDQALRYLSTHYGKQDSAELWEAYYLVERWFSLNCHPIVAMYALEMGVFFSILPALIKYGDVYAASVSQWIADDERVHVETGLRLMKALGLKLTQEVVKLVYDTNVYIFSPLGDGDNMGARAVKRLISGRDAQMLTESLPVTIAFFEQRSKGAIVY